MNAHDSNIVEPYHQSEHQFNANQLLKKFVEFRSQKMQSASISVQNNETTMERWTLP